ncbi:hypothetical protein N2152v2_009221 [Parachlorella kessleri]
MADEPSILSPISKGFSDFRGHQEEAVLGILSGRDVFVLMNTGGGKSLCYGLPPLVKPGVAVDQVQSFTSKGIQAEFLSSTQTTAQRKATMADLPSHHPATQLLFITPELLATDGFMNTLRWLYSSGSLLMVAVDEAHCISSYGHDFRPAYRQLGAVRRELQRVPIMALTATASAKVQEDICRQLHLLNPLRLVSSFNRPNITYEVRYIDLMRAPGSDSPPEDPLDDLLDLLQRQQQASPGGHMPCCVIYVHKRDQADGVAKQLGQHGIACKAYHAGLPDRERARVLEEFSRGELQVVAATVAFGMGIDRAGVLGADVRLVVHYSLPKSVEGFYQESGRAGRDGQPSQSILYYSNADRHSMEYLLAKDVDKLKKRKHEQQQGPANPSQLQSFGHVAEFCLTPRCRRAQLLAHFGEELPAPSKPRPAAGGSSGCCDFCDDPAGVAEAIRLVKELAAERQQQFQRGRHTLDFACGGKGRAARGGGSLEFESDRPREGLDFDEDRPSSFFDDEDLIVVSDEEEEEAALQQAQAALQRARQKGVRSTEAVLSALEAAERRYDKQEAAAAATERGSKSRLLAKLDGDAERCGGSAHHASSSDKTGVPESARENARKAFAKALSSNPSLAADLAAAGSGPAERLAAELEQQCYQGAQSKMGFSNKVSTLNLQIKRAARVAEVPQLAALFQAQPAAPTQERCQWQQQQQATGATADAPGTSGLPTPPLPCEAHPQQHQQRRQLLTSSRLAQLIDQAQQAASACMGIGQSDTAAAAQAVGALQQLAAGRATAELLLQTGAGKRVRALTKHPRPTVAAAAAAVYEKWKADVMAATPAH